jgi:hypothetical protein
MSFFTNTAYATYHPPSDTFSKTDQFQRRVDNGSMTSTTSTSSLSEFDPLSPLNLQRATDPWFGNSLVPPVTDVRSAPPTNNTKIFVADDQEEEWSEFVNFGAHVKDTSLYPSISSSSSHPQVDHDGWRPLQVTYDDDEEESSSLAGLNRQSSFSTQPQETATTSFFSRLTSFGSSSSLTTKKEAPPSSSPPPLPPRHYDAYDVTFEKGPIGLELETDWYGRQAVVKGFKPVNQEDGLAKTCGIIRIGDVLTAINGESCLELNFQQTLTKLRTISHTRHTLHFTSLEAAGDLSIYNQETDILLAKKLIHQHKETFYQAPLTTKLLKGSVERLIGETVTAFNFHQEDTGAFLLACSCANDTKGIFIFHTLQDSHLRSFQELPQHEDSAVYLGQMIPNFFGTEYTLVDHQQKRRNELGFIEYSTNVLGRIPNFLKVAFPKQAQGVNKEEEVVNTTRARAATTGSTGMGSNNAVFNTHSSMMDRNGTISERYKRVKQTRSVSLVERLRSFSLDDLELTVGYGDTTLVSAWHDEDDHSSQARLMRMKSLTRSTQKMLTPYGAVEQEDFDSDLLTFETRKPSWNEELSAWTLNFHGRVKMASKKNFLIVPEQGNTNMEMEFGEDTTYLRFGKVTKTRFTLDYQAPLSPFMALAIACSSFAHKIAVT